VFSCTQDHFYSRYIITKVIVASAIVIVNITIPYDITAIPSGFEGYNGIEVIPEYCPTDNIDKVFDI
jgi:hypothetical protein